MTVHSQSSLPQLGGTRIGAVKAELGIDMDPTFVEPHSESLAARRDSPPEGGAWDAGQGGPRRDDVGQALGIPCVVPHNCGDDALVLSLELGPLLRVELWVL